MAFRQPTTYHPPQRLYTTATRETAQSRSQQSPSSQNLEESTEWVLFSPESVTDHTRSTSTERTHRRSQVSELSRGTAARTAVSFAYGDGSGHTEVLDDEDEEAVAEGEGDEVDDAEDGELDSLDSHLQAFRADAFKQDPAQSSVLPTHDGLGSFRIDRTLMSDGVQQHLYSFERYNPRRVKRRRESLELGQLELESESADAERTRRIEAWRMEQSRILLDEIQKETRRRRMSMSTARHSVLDGDDDEAATMGSIETPRPSETAEASPAESEGEGEGFWSRITRRVIEDLIGIDDRLLSILFGEALPEDDDLSTTPPATQPAPGPAVLLDTKDDSWEYRLLERISRELGVLVNQLSDHPGAPGAFSTYLCAQQQIPLYAGLPAIPETVRDVPDASIVSELPEPQFEPTLPVAIPALSSSAVQPPQSEAARAELEREAWEKDLDITMVFRYLRSRFTSRAIPPVSYSANTAQLATASTSETAARAARVRRHHPLVNGDRPRPAAERRSISIRTSTAPAAASPTTMAAVAGVQGVHRRSSSCASQSTRLSQRRNSGSSKHYWDIGGSIGSGSLVVATGGMGSWGEV